MMGGGVVVVLVILLVGTLLGNLTWILFVSVRDTSNDTDLDLIKIVESQQARIQALERRERIIAKEVSELTHDLCHKISRTEVQALAFSLRRRISKSDRAIHSINERTNTLEYNIRNHSHSKEWVVTLNEVEEEGQ